jgi:hypothetical protein
MMIISINQWRRWRKLSAALGENSVKIINGENGGGWQSASAAKKRDGISGIWQWRNINGASGARQWHQRNNVWRRNEKLIIKSVLMANNHNQ